MFEKRLTYICGHFYNYLPAALKFGARIVFPDNKYSPFFYWIGFGAEASRKQNTTPKVKQIAREILRERRMSSSWFIRQSDSVLQQSSDRMLWLMQSNKYQLARWNTLVSGDLIFAATLDRRFKFVAKVAQKFRKKLRGYEDFPLCIEYSEIYELTSEEKMRMYNYSRWLCDQSVAGIRSIPSEISDEIVGKLASMMENPTMDLLPNPFLLLRVDTTIIRNQIFLVQSWDHRETILPTIRMIAESAGFSLKYADDRDGMVIFGDIWTLLNQSEVIVVDFSGKKPNVYLEYGMALVLGKPIVAITQSKDDIPSDTPNLKWILYDRTTIVKDLKDKLPSSIKTTKEDIENARRTKTNIFAN